MFAALAELALLREVLGPLLLDDLLSVLPLYTGHVLDDRVLDPHVLQFVFKGG